MAIALPVYVTDASVTAGLVLPKFVADASVTGGLKVPKFATDASVTGGLVLPAFQVQLSLNFTHVPTGGTLVGGAANIVGDPIIPTGGVLISGIAAVSSISVFVSTHFAYGGVALAGAPDGTFAWTTFKPTLGVLIGGAAPNSSASAVFPTAGGVRIGGAALEAKFIPSGGVLIGGAAAEGTGRLLIGGAAVISVPINFTLVPTGGVLISGVAGLTHVQPVTPTGGTLIGGVAVVKDAYPRHIPSGGIFIGGAAIAFALPYGTVSTPENPYGDDFPGWTINYETGAPSRYMGLPANSLCRFNGKTYVANAGGIYEVTGTTDAGQPIHASVTIPKTDFEDSHNKRIPAVYIGARSAGTLLLKVLVNGRSDRYYGVTAGTTYIRGSRVTLGKGLEARYWQFRIENMAGADFEIGDMEVKPTILKRHGV